MKYLLEEVRVLEEGRQLSKQEVLNLKAGETVNMVWYGAEVVRVVIVPDDDGNVGPDFIFAKDEDGEDIYMELSELRSNGSFADFWLEK